MFGCLSLSLYSNSIKNVLTEFVTILFLFLCFVFFDHEVYGILAHQLWIEPTSSALEGKILTTAPPGKLLLVIVLTSSGCQDKVP